jgi:hypothetical protein
MLPAPVSAIRFSFFTMRSASFLGRLARASLAARESTIFFMNFMYRFVVKNSRKKHETI